MNSIVITFLSMYIIIMSPDMGQNIQKVYDVSGKSKAEIYQKSLEWIAQNYNSANDVIQIKDEKNGKIIGRCYDKIFQGLYEGQYTYTITIDIKDNKFRLTFSNINSRQFRTNYLNFDFADTRERVKNKLVGIGEKLSTYILSSGNTDNDW